MVRRHNGNTREWATACAPLFMLPKAGGLGEEARHYRLLKGLLTSPTSNNLAILQSVIAFSWFDAGSFAPRN